MSWSYKKLFSKRKESVMSNRLFTCLLIGSSCFAVILGGCGKSEKIGTTIPAEAPEQDSKIAQGEKTTYKSPTPYSFK